MLREVKYLFNRFLNIDLQDYKSFQNFDMVTTDFNFEVAI